MFIPCPFLFAGIRTLISTFGNRTLSGRATSDETIRSCSPVSGIGCRCNFLSLLKFLSVGAMSQHATQIPYLTISEETVCPSPIFARHAAFSGAWKSHSTLTLLATQNYPFLLKYDCPLWLK